MNSPASKAATQKKATVRHRSDLPFFLVMSSLSACFVLLIVFLIVADVMYLSVDDFFETLQKKEIQAALKLTIRTCTLSTILSLWIGTPLGYLLARYKFPGKWLVDMIVDIPIVLPPLVLGLSLLILFYLPINGWVLDKFMRDELDFPVAFEWRAVVLAQFCVACAFVVRTMQVTFGQINPRAEDVARTLGCSRGQAFMLVALPQSWRGIISAATIAWARALGEFGPIMVFAGTTRMRTEVLSTSVFLEISIGNLEAAVAISLLMVMMAAVVLVVLRLCGMGLTS